LLYHPDMPAGLVVHEVNQVLPDILLDLGLHFNL